MNAKSIFRAMMLAALFLSIPKVILYARAKAISLQESTIPTATMADSEHIELIGHLGGMARSVAVQGNYAYAGFGSELAILDITDPASIQRIGWSIAPGEVWDISIAGDYAYIAYSGDQVATGLQVINLHSPTAPVSEYAFEFAYCGRSAYITVEAANAYFAYTACDIFGQNAGAYIYRLDITQPPNPSIIASNFYSMSSFNEIATGDGWLYALWEDITGVYMKAFDVSNSSGLVEVSSNRVANGSTALALAGGYAFLAAKENGMQVVEISDPTHPTPVITHTLPGTSQDINLSDDFAYLAAGEEGLQIVDVTDPLNPLDAGSYSTQGLSAKLTLSNGYTVLANTWGGLEIVQLSSLSQSGLLELPEKFNDLAVRNPHAFVAAEDGFWILNLSNPGSPFAITHDENATSCSSLVLDDNYAFVACAQSNLRILDISDPQTPFEATTYGLPGDTKDMLLADPFLYVAGDGMLILDISNPLSPVEIGTFDVTDHAVNALAVAGDYAYLALDNGNLAILDISDPSTPAEIGGYDPANQYGLGQKATAIQVQDYIVYLTTVEPPPTPLARYYIGDTWLIDVTDPVSPTLTSSISPFGAPYDVDIKGTTLAIAYEHEGLRLFDISDPTQPLERGRFNPPENVYGVMSADGLVHLYNNSLFITQYFSSTTQIYLPVIPQRLSEDVLTTQEIQ